MKLNIWQRGLLVVLVVGIALAFGSIPASATHDPFPASVPYPAVGGIPGNGYVMDGCHDFSKCGYNGPLIWNPYTIVASGFAWTKKHWEIPMLHGTRRGSELSQNDFVVPACFNELISGNGRVNDGIVDPIYGGPYAAPYSAWPVPEAEWLATFPSSVNHPPGTPGGNVLVDNGGTTAVPPAPNNYGVAANAPVNSQGGALNRCDRSSYKQLMYGGYNQRQGQYQNLPQRLKVVYDRNMPGSLVWDFSHPDAFKNSYGDARVTTANAGAPLPGKRDSEILSEPDAVANVNSMYDAGFSRGLGYNLYSLGLATQANGLLSEIGGHNMQSNTGFRKMNILNIETNTWYPRPHPCQRVQWEADRYGVALGYTAVADAVAGAGPGSGESLVNPPGRPLNAVDAPVWPLAVCNQHDKALADPFDPSDMRYWRWYPAASMLPNGMVVTYGGDDRDTTAAGCYIAGPGTPLCQPGTTTPSPTSGYVNPTSDPGVANFNNREPGLNNSTIQVPVMDVWDGTTDTQIAVENARMIFPLYPMSTARETGPGWDDWDFCTVGGERAPAGEAPLPRNDALDESAHWRDYCNQPGCAADTRAITRGAGGNGGNALDCVDILAAMADPNVNVPAENHFTYHVRSHNRYPYSNPMIDMTIVGSNGKTTSHKLFLIGGTQPTCGAPTFTDPDGNPCNVPTYNPPSPDPYSGTTGRYIEVIELSDGAGGAAVNPKWSLFAKLVQNTSASHALALPDGNIFSCCGGGAGNPANVVTAAECATGFGGPCNAPATTYEGAVNLRNQIICVAGGPTCEKGPGTVQIVGKMTVPRAGIHAVVHLLNTGEPLISAYDRTAIARANSRQFTPGDADLAVNSSQIFTPPYLYDASVSCPASVGCKLAKRPVINKGPDDIHYGKTFKLEVDDASVIKIVSLVRTGSATHSLAQDQTFTQIPFKIKKDKDKKDKKDNDKDQLEVSAPSKPVQAKPGDYMLFIVNNKGVPSMAKHVRLDDKGSGHNEHYVHYFTKPFPGEKKGKDKD